MRDTMNRPRCAFPMNRDYAQNFGGGVLLTLRRWSGLAGSLRQAQCEQDKFVVVWGAGLCRIRGFRPFGTAQDKLRQRLGRDKSGFARGYAETGGLAGCG